jgi:hypothetical protein
MYEKVGDGSSASAKADATRTLTDQGRGTGRFHQLNKKANHTCVSAMLEIFEELSIESLAERLLNEGD